MNTFISPRSARRQALWLLLCSFLVTSCLDHQPPTSSDATGFSADVVTSWLTLQLRLNQPAPVSQPLVARRFAYSGIALYESIAPGLAGYQSIAPQLNGLTGLPTVTPNARYYWPACANAAMAAMSRSQFPNASAALKTAIDSLEAANTVLYRKESSGEELNRSAEFGKKIAAAVFEWSKSDGFDNPTPYSLPVGAQYWVPTPPAFGPPALPHYGKCRTLVANSDAGAEQGDPIPYSEDINSAYYAQVKELYDISKTLTDDQRAMANFWPDNLWHNVLSQVLALEKPKLDVAAVAFAQLGIAMSDGAVSLFKGKYRYVGVRPVTYIRTVMNHPAWNTVIPTPAHPEYPSGHSVMSAAAAQTLTLIFGANYPYTDKPFNVPGVSPRSYKSFEEAASEASKSRLYAGIHYRKTCEVSLVQGKTIANTIGQKLKFKK
ncbi:vanadium-dependent haloperoxidase [Larkinella bovis]|uniref:Vanadium-dependent haloperoxidase n=1 Tax=Larkinella bovis TaxID=683041 RepID=A0ABW0IHE0_9BACT